MRRFALLAGCTLGELHKPCGAPDDCPLPLVCCSGSLALTVEGLTGAACFDPKLCTAGGGSYLPVLTEGSPCMRTPGADRCRGELVCCERTLSCATAAACEAAPQPAPAMSTDAPCGSDLDCAEGICCGISWTKRAGKCKAITTCAADNGVRIPERDAGLGVYAGPMKSIEERICESAYCEQSGPRAASPAELAACVDALRAGRDGEGRAGLRATESCRHAVELTRPLCTTLYRWRAVTPPRVNKLLPVFPGNCYEPFPPLSAVGNAACAKLARCNVVSDEAACRTLVVGMGYDALSRIAEWEGCGFAPERLGYAPPMAGSRCEADPDCPRGFTCGRELARGGLCYKRGCVPAECAEHGGSCDQDVCKLTCNARLRSGNERSAVEMQCGGRVNPNGRPVELACGITMQGTGLCTPATDLSMCAAGGRPLESGGVSWTASYVCKASPGTVARYEACTAGTPDPCASGVCLGGRCLEPCVLHPIGVGMPTCPSDELCATAGPAGWGAVAVCRPKCGAGGACPAGMRCEAGWPDQHCRH